MPESPRFLVQHDDHQKALDVLVRLHRNASDPDNTFAHQELQMIIERCQAEKEVIRTDGTWRLFTKKANRKKLLLAWLVMVGGQNIGPLVINNYNVLLYGSLGLGATTSLLLSAVYNTVGLIVACIGGLISDRLGRRRALSMSLQSIFRLHSQLELTCSSHWLCTSNVCFRDPHGNDRKVQYHAN